MNHIYGSPFPTLNPKVRYRTALERAGFEVNFGSLIPDNENNGELAERDQRKAVGPSLPSAEPWSSGQHRANSAGIRGQMATTAQNEPIPRYHYPAVRQSQPDGGSRQFSSTKPTSNSRIPSSRFVQKMQSNSTPSLRSSTPSNAPLYAGKESSKSENELDPIEKSFMKLTQNDASNGTGIVGYTKTTPSVASRESMADSVKRESMGHNTQIDASRGTVYSTVESLNFEPSSELHTGLLSLQQDDNAQRFEGDSSLPALTVKTRFSEGLHMADKVSPQLFGDKSAQPKYGMRVLDSDSGNVDRPQEKRPLSILSRDVETPQTATSSQVRELLAQLDDVSYTKNAQLDTAILAGTAANSSAGSQLDVRSLSVDRSRSCSNTSSRFKKSSAYLSQSPGDNYDIIPQSLTLEEEGVNPYRTGDSPVIYKFRPAQNDGFGQLQDRPQIVIERSQLSHKETIENSKDVTHPVPSKEPLGPDNLNEPLVDAAADTLSEEQPIHKFPPGEGPCRACGEEVHSRGIFSKRANELSGQWHRDCFRCLTCNVKFNKKMPCYILDDQPYCQQHYHERNGSICQVCQGFIEGECLENDRTERFHVHCLTCFLCETRITSDYFIYNGELPLCSEHDIEALLRDGLTGEPQSSGQDNTVSKRRTRLITLGQA
ncbi:hypothetical protein HG536_0H02330 [Torulaspora globosa]|uniref:LIM zinc-binding domain-containing protein n=1 Tax=Torulaspora globosa TaxID=48254 RepID=A0A7G3ZMX2_9SACH|nr:uncharacterized protein HG536_0H02330 [Torulaspora globosa]QLL34858.1 hypothetical protein HG536_0H02330 [Torulaspora globosa]